MRPADIGVYLPADLDATTLPGLVRRIEDAGYGGVWLTEVPSRDPFVHAGAVAALSDRLHVGIGVVNVRRQLPYALAQAIATLHGLAPGRVTVGLGPWRDAAALAAGAPPASPLAAMRDTTAIVRALLRGETVTYGGTAYSVTGATLRGAAAADVPLLWGANGPRMVAAAAELTAAGVANAVLVNYFHTTDEVARAVAAAGSVTAVVFAEVDHDEAAVVERLRAMVESSPVLRREIGVPDGAPVTAAHVAARVAAGPPERVRERIDAFRATGASVAVFADDVPALLDRLLA